MYFIAVSMLIERFYDLKLALKEAFGAKRFRLEQVFAQI